MSHEIWSNAAKSERKEPKKGDSRKLISLAPQRDFGITSWNLSPTKGATLHMAFTTGWGSP